MLAIAINVPQFSQKELLSCAPGLPPATFKQWVDRRIIHLSVERNPGRGRRPLYPGTDVLTVAATFALVQQGLPPGKVDVVIDTIFEPRIKMRVDGDKSGPWSVFVYFATETGELCAMPFIEGKDDQKVREKMASADIPEISIFFQMDRLIDRVCVCLQSLLADSAADETAADLKSAPQADRDFLRKWALDERGNKIRVGLTFEESEEYERLIARDLFQRGDAAFPETNKKREARADRYLELHGKHEGARMARIEEEQK